MSQQIPPVQHGNEREHRRLLAEAIKRAADGRSNAIGAVTLTAGTAVTVVADARLATDSVPLFTPITANAAAEQGAGTMYVAIRSSGALALVHANNGQTDRTFVYAIVG